MHKRIVVSAVLLAILSALLPMPTSQGGRSVHKAYLPTVAKPVPPQEIDLQFVFSEVSQREGDPRQVAVAFQSLTCIDARGRTLKELRFGTLEANECQGEGWFSNETWSGVGMVQWAGGASRRADLTWEIPGDTEGLLLHISSVVDGLWMEVKANGIKVAELQVDRYWHQGYVPLGPPVPEPMPDAEPEWTTRRYFPSFPPTDRLYVFRIPLPLADHTHGTVLRDWRIRQSPTIMTDLTLVGMQGIINRRTPRVYIEWYDPLAPFLTVSWTPVLERHVQVTRMDLDGLSAVNFLMRRYGSLFSGAVIYDPDVPETINLATMIAGLEDRIMLAPEQTALPGIPEFSSVTDLRQLVQSQGWDASEAAKHRIYQWVYDNLWPRLDHRIIGVVSAGPPTSRQREGGSDKYYQLDLTPRDYLVALRLPALWLSPADEPDAGLFNKFLQDAPSPVPLTGAFASMEHATVKIASEHGDFMTAINWPGGWITTGGLSALSGIRPALVRYDQQIDNNRILSTLGADHVSTLTSSDGDAIYYLMGRGFGPRFGWDYVQGQRFGWTISPLLSEIAPALWNFYQESRSDVSFVGGVSGVGYSFPVFMDDTELDEYLNRSAAYLAETGIRTVTVPSSYFLNRPVMARYYEELRASGYLGAFTDWLFTRYNLSFTYPGAPSPAVWSKYPALNESNLTQIVNAILADDNELFVDVAATVQHRGAVVDDADAYGGKAVLISSDFISNADLTAVDLDPVALLPGEYQVRFRLKVAQNQVPGRVAQLIVHSPGIGNPLLRRDIAARDFQSAGHYQEFSVPLSLASMSEDIRIQIVYDGGLTDLYIDTIASERQGEGAFPFFAYVGIDNIGDATARVPGDFIQAFESGGGVVLQPEEFIAALNPEYMLGLARNILGSGDPAIRHAQQQLAAGQYFSCLATVRDALAAHLGQQRWGMQPGQ